MMIDQAPPGRAAASILPLGLPLLSTAAPASAPSANALPMARASDLAPRSPTPEAVTPEAVTRISSAWLLLFGVCVVLFLGAILMVGVRARARRRQAELRRRRTLHVDAWAEAGRRLQVDPDPDERPWEPGQAPPDDRPPNGRGMPQ